VSVPGAGRVEVEGSSVVKLVGIRDGPRTVVGRLFADGTVAPLAEATEFSAEVTAVPPAARVLCEIERVGTVANPIVA
jgi:hypothetical protein